MSIYWILLMFQSSMLIFNSQNEVKRLVLLFLCRIAYGETEVWGE